MNKELISSNRFIFVDGLMKIDDELVLFSNIKGVKLVPKGNDRLLKKDSNGLMEKDNFEHEINLLINEDNKYSLFCGCSHKGIVNIIERTKDIIDSNLNIVIGGFHLMGMNTRKNTKKLNSKDFLDELSTILINNNVTKYYTCHCTGEEAYNYLNQKMDNLNELKTGDEVFI